jgi:hypothetical protein
MKSILIIWVLSNNGSGWVIEQHIPVDACNTEAVNVPQDQYYADPHHPDMRVAVCYTPTPPKNPTGPVGPAVFLPSNMTQPK